MSLRIVYFVFFLILWDPFWKPYFIWKSHLNKDYYETDLATGREQDADVEVATSDRGELKSRGRLWKWFSAVILKMPVVVFTVMFKNMANSLQEALAILNQENLSREGFPYWKFSTFNLDAMDETECKVEFRFAKADLFLLLRGLRFPNRFKWSQRTVCTGIEGLSILLRRLTFPCRCADIVSRFGRNPTEFCFIFNYVLNFVFETHHHRLNSWNQPFLRPH